MRSKRAPNYLLCVGAGWITSYLVAYNYGMQVASLATLPIIIVMTIAAILTILESDPFGKE